MFIRSERLFLRPGWPEDWTEILAGIANEAVARNLVQVPWPYTADDARWFAAREQDPRYPHFLVTLPGGEGARVIGCMALKPGSDGAELGYWIARPFWGRGFATEAARGILSLARSLGHRTVTARHFVDNPASGRVLRKLGFAPTGVLGSSFCPARGEPAPNQSHVLVLGDPDCDDCADNPAMRAA